MGLKDAELLEEIGDLYAREDATVQNAISSYRELVKLYPQNGEGWQKLGDTICRVPLLGRTNEAIDGYKRAIELVEGEGNKQKIAMTLQELLITEGREQEIEPYRRYLNINLGMPTATGGEFMNSSFGASGGNI